MFNKKLKNLIYLLKKIKNNLIFKIKVYFKPYNIIKIRDMENQWFDVDYKMFLILKQLFIDFIELEKPFTYFLSDEFFNNKRCDNVEKMQQYINQLEHNEYEPFDEFQKHKNELQELLDLYKWFKIDHKILQEECYNKDCSLSSYEQQLKLYEEETKKLMQLISIRGRLWT